MQVTDIPQNINPLDFDFSQVEIKRAVLQGGLPYELLVKKCELQDNKKHPGDQLLYVELANLHPATGPTGDQINPGQVVIFDRLNLKAYGKATPQMVHENLIRFQQAFGHTGNLGQLVSTAAGRTVRAMVGLEPAGTNQQTGKSYPEKNVINYYFKPGQT